MVVTKHKKRVKFRGNRTHGCGAAKKRRGAGNKGGKGMSGSGKRGDQKKSYVLKVFGNAYFGHKGFTSHKKKLKTINIGYIDMHIDSWIKKGYAKDEKGTIFIDLVKLGYDKLLGRGNVTRKYKIEVDHVSGKTQEKIKSAGGEIIGEITAEE
jgi:large subunit ribosomal protein L15